MKKITAHEYRLKLKAQGVSGSDHHAFKCPSCGTAQSIAMMLKQGIPREIAEKEIGISCIGRHAEKTFVSRAERIRKQKTLLGCDWTLQGAISLHKLEVICVDNMVHPQFEVATSIEAKDLENRVGKCPDQEKNA